MFALGLALGGLGWLSGLVYLAWVGLGMGR